MQRGRDSKSSARTVKKIDCSILLLLAFSRGEEQHTDRSRGTRSRLAKPVPCVRMPLFLYKRRGGSLRCRWFGRPVALPSRFKAAPR